MRLAVAALLVTLSQAAESTCTEIEGLGATMLTYDVIDKVEKVTLENCKKCAGTAKCMYDMQLLYFNTVKTETEGDGKFTCSELDDFFDKMKATCGMLNPDEITKWREAFPMPNTFDDCEEKDEGDDPEITYARFSTSKQPWQKSGRGAMPSEEEGCELNTNEAVVCWSGWDINMPRDLYDGYYPWSSYWPVSSGGAFLDGWTEEGRDIESDGDYTPNMGGDGHKYVNEGTGETRQPNDPPLAPYAAYGINDSSDASRMGCVAEFEKLATASIAKYQPKKKTVKAPGAETTPDSAAPATAAAALAFLATLFAAM